MNWYRLHVYGYDHYNPGAPESERYGRYIGSVDRDVQAHDAADAVFCYERSHSGSKVMDVRCVAPPLCACGAMPTTTVDVDSRTVHVHSEVHKFPCPLVVDRADPLKNNRKSWAP